MNIRIIKNAEDYKKAKSRVAELMALDLKPGTDAQNELELLALVMEYYEKQIVPPARPDPVEAVLFRMEQMNLKRGDLVPYLGSLSKVSEVLTRKRPLSLTMIRRLHKGLGIPSDVLISGVENKITGLKRSLLSGFGSWKDKDHLELDSGRHEYARAVRRSSRAGRSR